MPTAVFALTHPWMQEMTMKAAPAEFEVKFLDSANAGAVQALLPQADVLMANHVPADWVPLLQRCKLVQHQGVGYDGIDVAALSEAGIPVALTPEGTVIGVAEHTILLILALYKQLVQVHLDMKPAISTTSTGGPTTTFSIKKRSASWALGALGGG